MLYTLIHPLTWDPYGLEVWMQYRPFISGAKCSTWDNWDSNLWPLVTLASDTMSKDQLNQKFKPMVKAPGYVIYSLTFKDENIEPSKETGLHNSEKVKETHT